MANRHAGHTAAGGGGRAAAAPAAPHNAALKEGNALTGPANHHQLLRLRQTAAGGAPALVEGGQLLIDIDHFKPVNNGHGHAVGDQVLTETARRIAAAVRPQDLVAR